MATETVLTRLNHIVIVVSDIDRASADWERLGLTPRNYLESDSMHMKRVQFDVGDAYFALVEPLDERSVFHGFMAKRGEGLFAMSFDVDDYRGVTGRMREAGTRFTGDEDSDSVWIHPKHTHGVNLGLHAPGEHPPTEASLMRRVSYIVIAVNSRDEAAADWERSIGVRGRKALDMPEAGMRRVQFDVGGGELWIAIVEPLGPHSYQRKFLAEHPEGVYMVAVSVGDPHSVAREMKERGAQIVGDPDGDGPVYVHPHTTHGLLLGLTA
jgi:catechol 2,3-dioxygenase-like lactoylglutathione lyase family enzyme